MKRCAVGVLAAAIVLGTVPGAQAAPALAGSITSGSDPSGLCAQAVSCAVFFHADCPTPLVRPDGATVSIVPVHSSLWDKTLRFSWTDANTRAYDAAAPTAGAATPFAGRLYLSISQHCDLPQGPPTVTLGTKPSERSRSIRIPRSTRWIVAWSMPGTADVKWLAT